MRKMEYSLPSQVEHPMTNTMLGLSHAQNGYRKEQLTADRTKTTKLNVHADNGARLEIERMTKQVKKQEIALVSARIVDSRVSYRDNQQFVEYKLQLETDCRGVLFVWHRYSTFRRMTETLQAKQRHCIENVPELPRKQIFGNFSQKLIEARVAKLNQFLEAATCCNHLEWGIRVDADTCVFKRHRKSTPLPASSLIGVKSRTPLFWNSDGHHHAFALSTKVVATGP